MYTPFQNEEVIELSPKVAQIILRFYYFCCVMAILYLLL